MKSSKIRFLFETISRIPIAMIVILGFLISYFIFFIHPIFINIDQLMHIPVYLPVGRQIGMDLKETIDFSNTWLTQGRYVDNKPPLVILLFAPLRSIRFAIAYKLMTAVNLLCYAMIALVFPLVICWKKQSSTLLTLIFITGLFSYGFQFELERGQFDVLAVFLSFVAIWIFHYQEKNLWLSYILFCISVQMKLYPLIFILLFISVGQDWKKNLKRVLLLLSGNVALLFVLGLKSFTGFISYLTTQSRDPIISSILNHSIFSFVTFAAKVLTVYGKSWANNLSGRTQIVLSLLVIICVLLVLYNTYKQKTKGINPILLLTCTIAALLIPAMSNDYTLAILTAPVAIFLMDKGFWERIKNNRFHTIDHLLLFIFSIAYSSTLFSYTNKPALWQKLLQNNFPALFVMLLIVTFYSLQLKPSLDEK